jgi:hypothetical protein
MSCFLEGETSFIASIFIKHFRLLFVRHMSISTMDIAKDAMAMKAESYHNEHPSQEISAAPAIPQVVWYRHQGLRKLYAMMPILFLG